MKTLYLDIFSGISGDMFIGALLDLGVDFHQFEHELEKLGVGDYHLHVSRQQRGQIAGTKFDVDLEHDHEHTHEEKHAPAPAHSHEHSHQHGEGKTRGPHGGPLVAHEANYPGAKRGHIELSVFELNVPPRFRLYFLDEHGHAIKPMAEKNVTLETIRKGKQPHLFKFKKRGEYLEAIDELPEPHEFKALVRIKRGARIEKLEAQFVEDHHHHVGPEAGAPHEHSHQHGSHSHSHSHTHSHEPHHHHDDCEHHHGRTFADIRQMIHGSKLSDWVKQRSVAVFHRVAVAEGKIHGNPPDEVHFHEVGAVDSIVDIVGACVALEMLGKPRILAAPAVEGTGWVKCAHGRFPVPTPATLEILGARGVAVSQCDEPHELVTPTGAALLAELVESFGPMRGLTPLKIGYGLGSRENKTRPNVLRAVLGETAAATGHDWETDTIAVLQTNLDDTNAELLGGFVEQALSQGALDVFHTAIQMKKSRPGVLLSVLCTEGDADKFSELILRETTAFGVRRAVMERRKLRREFSTVNTPFGEVQIKLGKLDGQILQAAPEFESCRRLAETEKVPVKQIYDAALRALNP